MYGGGGGDDGRAREGDRGMKFLAVERARETTVAGLVEVLRFALMETVAAKRPR